MRGVRVAERCGEKMDSAGEKERMKEREKVELRESALKGEKALEESAAKCC